MPQIQTPLAQVFSTARQQSFSPAASGVGVKMDAIKKEMEMKERAQRISNLGQAAMTGLDIINKDPENAESALRTMIAQRRAILPTVGITNMEDTDELEKALNEGGGPQAQEVLSGALNAVRSVGFELPKPTTPSFTGAFQGKDEKTGKEVTFLRSNDGRVINTGIPIAEKAPAVSVSYGDKMGKEDQRKDFNALLNESKVIDKTLFQFNQVRDIVAEGGLGSIGTSGKVTKGFEKAASAIGGFIKNTGIIDDFDEDSILHKNLKGTMLGKQAMKNAKVASLITNLAYTIAKTQDKGGRITDQDFAKAIQTIGANADNPEQLVEIVNQFGSNLLQMFDNDVDRIGGIRHFSDLQYNQLKNMKSREGFVRGLREKKSENENELNLDNSFLTKGITAMTKPSELTKEQAQELAKNNPELLREIIANAKRGQ